MNTPRLPDLELLKIVGSGSYGEVWLARTLTGMFRAVKVISRSRFKDERPWLREFAGISRFQRDMTGRSRQLALLHVGEDKEQGLFYYVMELADDLDRGSDIDPESYRPSTLKAVREQRPDMPLSETLRLAVDLTRALAELHEAGLVHRDIKPSNIIFVQGVPKLADLGLISSTEHSLTSLGTPGYSPPEGAATPRSDIFSLGKVLYEQAMKLPSSEFPRLPPFLANSPEAEALMELNEVILVACNKNPLERYRDAQAMLKDLLHIQAGGSLRELARMRLHLGFARKLLVFAGALGLAGAAVFGFRHYQALRIIAAQESAAHAKAEEDSRNYSYASDIHLAQISASSRDFGGVRTALRRQLPRPGTDDLRGPEWWALWNAFVGDSSASWVLPDRPQIAFMLWDSRSRQVLWQASNNERLLGTLDPATGKTRILAKKSWRLAPADAKGKLLTSIERRLTDIDPISGALYTWPGKTGSLVQASSKLAIVGRYIGNKFELHILDRETRLETQVWTAPDSKTDSSPTCMDLSPDDGRLFLIYFETGAVRERTWVHYDLKAKRELWSLKTSRMSTCTSFSPDGSRIAIGGPGWLGVWDAASGNPVWIDDKAQGQTDTLLWSEDGASLRSSGSSRRIRMQDAATGQELGFLEGAESSVSALSMRPDTRTLFASDSSGTLGAYNQDAQSGRHTPVLPTWPEFYGSAAFSKDGSRAAVTDSAGRLVLMDTKDWHQLCLWEQAFRPLSITADGSAWLAMDKENRLVRCLVEPAPRVELTGLRCNASIKLRYVATSPDGRWTAIASNDGRCEIWDLSEGRSVALLPLFNLQHPITALCFSADNTRLVVADDQGHLGTVQTGLWDVFQRLPDCSGAPYAAAADITQAWIALGMEDGRIQILDTKTQQWCSTLQAHHGQISSLTLTRDGRRLISGGQDGLLIYTDTKTWRPMGAGTFLDPANHQPIDITHVLLDQASQHLIVATGAGEGHVLDIAPSGPQKE